MQLLSVNVGVVRPLDNGKSTGTSGIFKIPTTEPVRINQLGLEGDSIVDLDNHGGEDQAVYIFGQPDYDWWSMTLGKEILPGTFGENLTISDLESGPLHIGDRLHIGAEVCLEFTAARIPCSTLAARMGDPTFVKKFRKAERPGLYCRVITPGTVRAGDTVRLEEYTGVTVTAAEMFRAFYHKNPGEDILRRLVASPEASRARQYDEYRLAQILDGEQA